MRRLVWALACGAGGYLAAAVLGYLPVAQFASNVHDRATVAAMTAVFVVGPAGGLVGLVLGAVLGKTRRTAVNESRALRSGCYPDRFDAHVRYQTASTWRRRIRWPLSI